MSKKDSKLSPSILNLETVEQVALEDILTYIIEAFREDIRISTNNLIGEILVDEAALAMVRLINAVELCQFHLEMVLEIMKSSSDEEIPAIKAKWNLVSSAYDQLKSKADIMPVPIKYSMATMHDRLYLDFKVMLHSCFKEKDDGEFELVRSAKNTHHLQIATGRFESFTSLFPMLFSFPKDDIFCHEKSSHIWQDLYNSATFKEVLSKEELHLSIRQLRWIVRVSQIVLTKNFESKSSTMSYLSSIVQDVLYYAVNQKEAEILCLHHLIEPKVEHAFLVWNLMEVPAVSWLLDFRHPVVGYDEVIYVPRLFPRITKEVILKDYEDNTFNKLQPMDPSLFIGPNLKDNRKQVLKDLTVQTEDKIAIRILAWESLNLHRTSKDLVTSCVHKVARMLPGSSSSNDDTAIVIHIHGGGFVSMSSFTHKVYLSRWVKNLKMIHFSIDYRLSPKNQYPDALDDVWQGYLWIINYAETVLGIKKSKVIIAGDSAGGNLALALMLRLVRAGQQTADGCFLAYPNLYVDGNSFSPSYFLSVNDPLLPYSLLKMVAKSYVPEGFKNTEDPFISPMLASDELLEGLPPIRIIAGSNDPLFDDNWRLLSKLRKLKKDAHMIVHKDLNHAYFCNLDLKKYNYFIEEACDSIRELISLKKD